MLASSSGITLLEADIKVSIYSYPLGVGKDPVWYGYGNKLPEGVMPKNAVYKSSTLKLLAYNFTPKSRIASATKSLDIP